MHTTTKILARLILLLATGTIWVGCEKEVDLVNAPAQEDTKIRAVDISSFPEIDQDNVSFYNSSGIEASFLSILSDRGINTVRLRLWVNPQEGHSSLDEVSRFARTLKEQGFKIWLSLHYSDTWADPGQQETPEAWQLLNSSELSQKVYDYTTQVMSVIEPEFIQIGNEINSGMLHPLGDISRDSSIFLRLLQSGSAAVRDSSPDTKIIVHYAGIEGSSWFFNQVAIIDYDIIGLSYYPIWHGKSLDVLQATLQNLSNTYSKDVLIAETAYPFTLGFNDFTNNIVGLESQLILPQFPATPLGQKQFIERIHSISTSFDRGLGFCYWGAELVAWKGDRATDASPWENQALFDFNHRELPVLEAFND